MDSRANAAHATPRHRPRSGSNTSQQSWYFKTPPPEDAVGGTTSAEDAAAVENISVSLPRLSNHSRQSSVAISRMAADSGSRVGLPGDDEDTDDVDELFENGSVMIKLPAPSRAGSVVNGGEAAVAYSYWGSSSQYGGSQTQYASSLVAGEYRDGYYGYPPASAASSHRHSYYSGSQYDTASLYGYDYADLSRAQDDYYRQHWEYYYGPQGLYPDTAASIMQSESRVAGAARHQILDGSASANGEIPQAATDTASVCSRYEEAYRADSYAQSQYEQDYYRWYQEQYWNNAAANGWDGREGRELDDWARGGSANYDPWWNHSGPSVPVDQTPRTKARDAPQASDSRYGDERAYNHSAGPKSPQVNDIQLQVPDIVGSKSSADAQATPRLFGAADEPSMRDVSAVNTPCGGSPLAGALQRRAYEQWREETSASAIVDAVKLLQDHTKLTEEIMAEADAQHGPDVWHQRRASSTFGARTPNAMTPISRPRGIDEVNSVPDQSLENRSRSRSDGKQWSAHELGPPALAAINDEVNDSGSSPTQITSHLSLQSAAQKEAAAEAERLRRKASMERKELEAAAAEQNRIMSQMDQLRDKITALERERSGEARRAQEAEQARKRAERESQRIVEQETERQRRDEQERKIKAEVERRMRDVEERLLKREAEESKRQQEQDRKRLEEERLRRAEQEAKEAEEAQRRLKEDEERRKQLAAAEAKRLELEEAIRQAKLTEDAHKLLLERQRILGEAEEATRRARDAEEMAQQIRESAERERRLLEELEKQRRETEERERARLRDEEVRRIAELEEIKRRQLAEFELRRRREEEQAEAKLRQMEEELNRREQDLVEREAARRRAQEPDTRIWKTYDEWLVPNLEKSDGSHLPPPPVEGPPKHAAGRRTKSVFIRPGELAELGIDAATRSPLSVNFKEETVQITDKTPAQIQEDAAKERKRRRDRRGKSISNADIMRAPVDDDGDQDMADTRNAASSNAEVERSSAAAMREVAASNRSRRDKRKSRSGKEVSLVDSAGARSDALKVSFAPKPVVNGVKQLAAAKENESSIAVSQVNASVSKPPQSTPPQSTPAAESSEGLRPRRSIVSGTKPLLEMNIETKNNGRQRLTVHANEDPRKVAVEFCQKHGMIEVREGLSQLVVKAVEKRKKKAEA